VADWRDELKAGLDRVRGAVELAVRAHPRETEEAPKAGSGAEYMRAKARRAEAARLLHEPLASLARDSVEQPGPELLRAAYLVDRDAVSGFVSLVRGLGRDHPRLDIVCTGPWPPYSFAER
jgi:Gas vesicle synthesis protein GvpL/GvpF